MGLNTYIFLHNEAYSEHRDDWVRIAGRIHSVSSSNINIRYGLGERLTDNVSITVADFNDNDVEPGDYVVIVGQVGLKLMGQLHLSGAIVEDVGVTAEALHIALREQGVHALEYAIQAREEARATAEREFRDSARTVSYDNLIRYPSRYEGEAIRVTVRITQIFDRGGILGGLFERGFAGTQGGNEWIIAYDLPEDARRILVGDTVTFYGIYNGVTARQRAIGGARACRQ